MQISNSVRVVCASMAAFCILPPSFAADADNVAKLREALHQKVNELQQATPAAPASALPPSSPENVAKQREALRKALEEMQPRQPAPVPAQPSQPTQPPQTVQTEPSPNPEIIAKEREVLEKRLKELREQPIAQTAPAANTEALTKEREALELKLKELQAQDSDLQKKAEAEMIARAARPGSPTASGASKDAAAEAQARKNAEMATRIQSDAKAKAEKAAREQADARAKAERLAREARNNPAIMMNPQPLQPPPLPISMDKEKRLQELLKKYRADEVTPEQYHEQRAKILAEP